MRIASSNVVDVAAGISLALILQTSYRFDVGVGIGEVGVAACILYGFLFGFLSRNRRQSTNSSKMAMSLMVYFLAVLAPTTVVYWLFGTPGTSIRDLLAYFLSFAFLYSLAIRRTRVDVIVYSFLLTLFALVFYQYYYGGDQAWYWTRFTGGAKNPNQLALYVICGITLAFMCVRATYARLVTIAILVFFGIATLSDAFLAYSVTLLVTGVFVRIVPRNYFVFGWLPLVLGSSILIAIFGFEILEFAGQQWGLADQDYARPTLYVNGLRAWLSSPFSFVVGNGAGSFSGFSGPFEIKEAHNTPIDLLAMGGVIGLFANYYYPVRNVYLAYRHEMTLLFTLLAGVIVFTMFHFVARHPIFWFTVFAAVWMIDARRSEKLP